MHLTLSAREVLTKAKKGGYALGAFNVGNLELAKAVVGAAADLEVPVIIETSVGEARHFGIENFLCVVKNLASSLNVSVLTNFDHGPGLEECQEAIKAGYQLVHFDGSSLPYEENVKITKALVAEAHQKGVLIEGEIDKILGRSAPHEEAAESLQDKPKYTDPAKAADFVRQTGVDILAVFIGNLHGTFSSPERLDLERLKEIAEILPCFLSLHGGSGVEDADLLEAIGIGQIVKINVNTSLRVTYRDTLENVLKGSEEVAIYKIMPPVTAAVQKMVEEKIQLFGSNRKVE